MREEALDTPCTVRTHGEKDVTQWLTDRAPARSSSSGRPVDHQAAQTAGQRTRLAHPMMRRITQLVLDLHRLTHRREAGPPLISEIPARTAMALCADGALLAIRPGEHAPIAPLAAYGLAAPAPIAVPAHIAPAAFAGCRSGRGQDALADHLATAQTREYIIPVQSLNRTPS